MKQNSGSLNCIEIVANMAAGASPGEFKLLMGGRSGPYSDHDFARFMFAKGYMITVGVPGESIQPMIDVSDSDVDELIPSGKSVCAGTEIFIKFKIGDFPAFIVVEAETDPEKEHAIYWDGQMIHDPNPMSRNNRPFSEYRIKRFYPIIKDRSRDEDHN